MNKLYRVMETHEMSEVPEREREREREESHEKSRVNNSNKCCNYLDQVVNRFGFASWSYKKLKNLNFKTSIYPWWMCAFYCFFN